VEDLNNLRKEFGRTNGDVNDLCCSFVELIDMMDVAWLKLKETERSSLL